MIPLATVNRRRDLCFVTQKLPPCVCTLHVILNLLLPKDLCAFGTDLPAWAGSARQPGYGFARGSQEIKSMDAGLTG